MAPALPKTEPAGIDMLLFGMIPQGETALQDIDAYEQAGGYAQLKGALGMSGDDIIANLKTSGLRGRGGAGFPTGMKMGFIPKDSPRPTYLVVNADESEPGTAKDREIIERQPHLLIEGCLIAAHAIGAESIFIYIRGEYLEPFEVLRHAAEQARAKGYIGPDVAGSGKAINLVIHRGAGAYICGEETALLSSLNGERGQPTVKPPFPAISGLYAAPTLVNNVETMATVPRIMELGGDAYAEVGAGSAGTGTRVFTLSGHVNKPGNYEVPLGTPLSTLVNEMGGGVLNGRRLKGIIPGGSSMPILRADQIDTGLDFDSMAAQGTMLGSGAVIVLDERVCMVQLALRVAEFYRHESCGKCTPCREGTRWVTDLLVRLERGDGTMEDIDTLESVNNRVMGNCLCPLGDAMAMPVLSYLEHYREDFVAHVEQGGCPYDDSPIEDVLAQRVQPPSNVTWTGRLSSPAGSGSTATRGGA